MEACERRTKIPRQPATQTAEQSKRNVRVVKIEKSDLGCLGGAWSGPTGTNEKDGQDVRFRTAGCRSSPVQKNKN